VRRTRVVSGYYRWAFEKGGGDIISNHPSNRQLNTAKYLVRGWVALLKAVAPLFNNLMKADAVV
jgi:hypothetical protein